MKARENFLVHSKHALTRRLSLRFAVLYMRCFYLLFSFHPSLTKIYSILLFFAVFIYGLKTYSVSASACSNVPNFT